MPYEETFTALAHPVRQRILDALDDSPKSVTDLTRLAKVSQPVASQHLKVLKEAGLVTVTAQGTTRIYAVAPDALAELRAFLETRWRAVIAASVPTQESPHD